MVWNGALFDAAGFSAIHEAHLELMQQQPQLWLRINPYLAYELEGIDSREVGLVAQLKAVEQAAMDKLDLEDTCDADDTEIARCTLLSLQRLAQYQLGSVTDVLSHDLESATLTTADIFCTLVSTPLCDSRYSCLLFKLIMLCWYRCKVAPYLVHLGKVASFNPTLLPYFGSVQHVLLCEVRLC